MSKQIPCMLMGIAAYAQECSTFAQRGKTALVSQKFSPKLFFSTMADAMMF